MDNITDYHNFSDINTTKEERERLHIGSIYSNGIKCKKCGYYIRSRNRHDMVTCKCGSCSIDGGSWYVKISAHNGADLEDIEIRTISFSDVDKENS